MLAAVMLAAAAGEFEVAPRELAWEDLSPAVHDRSWRLPEPRRAGGVDLLAELRGLTEARFELRDASGRTYRRFGDLARRAAGIPDSELGPWLASLTGEQRDAFEPRRPWVEQLLRDAHLVSDAWTPARDHVADGLLMTQPWRLDAEPAAPWSGLPGRPQLEQAAALLRADLATIKDVENDYRGYPANVGAEYEEIFPVEDSYFVGEDAAGRPFSALRIRFTCDLPFPFSSYTTRLGIFNRYDADGLLRTDIYSTSRDFHWLAGRDVFLPVRDSADEPVGWLLVRHFGFDLDGVPDGASHRREALRSSLGNLKRNSERAFARHLAAGGARVDEDFLHEVRVRGTR